MKILLPVCVLAALAAGCAAQGDTLAQAPCKVAPVTTLSATGKAKPVSSIEQRDAQMQLASSGYRMRQLRERGLVNNTVEDALRDCDGAPGK
jgi:uncharacterized lipoprotein YajG